MQSKYYMAMAYDAGGIGQSDYLYLIRLNTGAIIGYAGEFEMGTYDVEEACSPEKHHSAKWFRLRDDDTEWTPATLDEIKSLKLEECLIGSKKDMKVGTPVDPI